MILSQLGMQTRPSKQCARAIVSTESAMISREASEYFMPVWPMAIPSQTAMVLNSKGGPARPADGVLDHLGHLVEVNMARHNLAEAVGNADERLIDVGITQTAGAKQTAMRRPLKTLLDCVTFHNPASPNVLNRVIQKRESLIVTAGGARIKKNQLFKAR